MPYFSKTTGARIRGTLETLTACYPVTRDPATGAWTYSGEERDVFDEGAEIQRNAAGELMFLDTQGNEVPESDLVWREEVSA